MRVNDLRPNSRPRLVFGAACACIAFAIACNRDATAPTRVTEPLHPRVPSKANFNISSSLDQFTAATSGPNARTGAELNTYSSPITTLPTPTWYRISATGVLTMTPDPRYMPGQPTLTYQPAGYARVSWGDGWNNGSQTLGTANGDSTAGDYALMWANVTAVDRPGVGAVNYNAYCGTGYPDPCGNYTGPATTFTFTRLNADLTLTADSTNVAPGSTVTFTFAASPAQVEGKTMPVVVDSVRWVPDSSGAGAEKTEQTFNGSGNSCNPTSKTCTRQIVGSGTFTLIAWVNGKAITKSVHIQTPSLNLKAVKKNGAKGRNVTFTPTWSDGASVTPAGTSWAWAPDSVPGQTSACGAGTSPCTTAVKESGTMTVTVTRNGVPRTARVHVSAVPCVTNDSILDDAVVRTALDSLWKLSRGDTTTNANRIELALAIFDAGGTTVVRFLPTHAGDDACRNAMSVGAPSSYPGTLLAVVHTHPAKVGETVQCNPTKSKKYSDQFGGPSYADWGVSLTFNPPIPNYVLDAMAAYRMFGYPPGDNYWQAAFDANGNPILDDNGDQIFIPKRSMWRNYYQKWNRKSGSCSILSLS